MKNVTIKLAEGISQLKYEHIPAHTLERVKCCILDSLGCALAGSSTEWSRIINHYVQSQEGVREASLWTTGFVGPAASVVLGNGAMIHSYDFDDYHRNKIHPGAVVIPAAFAIGEKERIDGKMLITAIVAGYETMIHISSGVNPGASRMRGFHLTGTCGTFAAAAAAGKIWGFNADAMASAFGMAGTQSAGLWAFTADGSLSKRFHPGRSAQSGIMAASLARNGFRGPTMILEAPDGGFFKATSYDFDFSKVLQGLGEKFDTEDVVIKPYPACASLHSSVDAVLLLKKQKDINASRIKEINVYNSELVNVQCGFDYQATGVLEAQMSMKYCMARTAMDNVLSLEQFSQDKITDPKALDLAKRVHFVLDEGINKVYPLEWPSIVEIVMVDGAKYKARVDVPRGSGERPLTWPEVQDKYRALALPVLKDKKAERVIEIIDTLEDASDLEELRQLMSTSA